MQSSSTYFVTVCVGQFNVQTSASTLNINNKRIKYVKEFTYFGNSAGFFFPNLSIKHSQNKKYKTLVKKLIKGSDKLLLKDGSIKDRTTRGNRALWYHHSALGEAFIIMEIAKAANVKLPKNYEKKLLKAVELFHDAYLDHSVIEPWAKKKYNSYASNGKQDFRFFFFLSRFSFW